MIREPTITAIGLDFTSGVSTRLTKAYSGFSSDRINLSPFKSNFYRGKVIEYKSKFKTTLQTKPVQTLEDNRSPTLWAETSKKRLKHDSLKQSKVVRQVSSEAEAGRWEVQELSELQNKLGASFPHPQLSEPCCPAAHQSRGTKVMDFLSTLKTSSCVSVHPKREKAALNVASCSLTQMKET